MRAVVHADHGDGKCTLCETMIEERRYLAHVAHRLLRTGSEVSCHILQGISLGIGQTVALFGNGEGSHLERGLGKDLL